MEYRGKCEGWVCSHKGNESIWKELKEKVKGAIKKISPWQLEKRGWHSRVEERKKVFEKNAKRSEKRKD